MLSNSWPGRKETGSKPLGIIWKWQQSKSITLGVGYGSDLFNYTLSSTIIIVTRPDIFSGLVPYQRINVGIGLLIKMILLDQTESNEN